MSAMFAPSLMCMDFLRIREQMEILNQQADIYHVDVMDGHFCKNMTISPDMLRAISAVAKKPIEVHLMTTTPDDWIELFAKAGADIISPHAETINTDAFRIMNKIEGLELKTGVTLNPATPLSYVEHYLNRINVLTIMSVDVGFAGQPFIEEIIPKIQQAKRFREEHGLSYIIQVDGACNQKTFRRLHEAGTDCYVVGTSGLFNLDPDLSKAYEMMKQQFEQSVAGSENP